MYLTRMFGFHDHVVNRRTGRPEEHYAWVHETFLSWTVWTAAMFSIALAAFIVIWGKVDLGSVYAGGVFAGVAVFFSMIGLWRRRALERKRRALRMALIAYEEGLARAFDLTSAFHP